LGREWGPWLGGRGLEVKRGAESGGGGRGFGPDPVSGGCEGGTLVRWGD